MDDLHRRWLPREIFADIGIADVVDAAPPAVEDASAFLAGKIVPIEVPPPPPPAVQPQPQPQVCGLQAMASSVPPYAYPAPPPPCPWPMVYLPLQWQMPPFLGGPWYYPYYQAGAGAGVGTGVFLPRVGAGQQHLEHNKAASTASPAPATDGRLPEKEKEMNEKKQQQQQQGKEEEEEEQKREQEEREAAAEVLLALPKEWTY